jgi:hypothetical protein
MLIGESRRASGRIRLSTLASVEYYPRANAKWIATARLVNINRSGAAIRLNRYVEPGRLIHFRSRIPFRYRAFDFESNEFTTWAVVRHITCDAEPDLETIYVVGLAFIGPEAPESFLNNPLTCYDLAEKPELSGLWRAIERSPSLSQAAT